MTMHGRTHSKGIHGASCQPSLPVIHSPEPQTLDSANWELARNFYQDDADATTDEGQPGDPLGVLPACTLRPQTAVRFQPASPIVPPPTGDMNPAWNADTLNVPQFPPGVLLGNIDFGHGTAEPLFPRVPRPTHSLHGLLPVVGHQLSAADKVFSWKVVHVLKKEMLEYIPLDQLTDEACHTAAHEPPVPESTFVMADGKLHLHNTSFNLSKEIKLTYKDWSAASDNLVDAMHKHLWAEGDNHSGGCIAQAIANSFAAHFKNLHNLPNARVEFDVVLDYDCHLHCMFLTNSHTFNMAHFHRDVWHKLLEGGILDMVPLLPQESSFIASDAVVLNTNSPPARTTPIGFRRMVTPRRLPLGNQSATLSIAGQPARLELPAPMLMSAPCVTLSPTVCRPVLLESIYPLSTPLHADCWEAALALAGFLDMFAEVPEGLCSGFDIGLDSFALMSVFSPPNHFCTTEAHEFVVSKYAKEIALGRVSPGYPPKVALALFGLHQSAPLNVIFSARGKLHITLDLSYPHNDPLVPSINSLINATHFKCDWSTFSACWLLVANAPEGTQVVVFDVDSAF
ncbi:hypothetical protein E4T56_gene2054 [Termitomyces sp. T112]|nr:hypothetical protein E4T56_gene2054 [Termitomyces sp. T112]